MGWTGWRGSEVEVGGAGVVETGSCILWAKPGALKGLAGWTWVIRVNARMLTQRLEQLCQGRCHAREDILHWHGISSQSPCLEWLFVPLKLSSFVLLFHPIWQFPRNGNLVVGASNIILRVNTLAWCWIPVITWDFRVLSSDPCKCAVHVSVLMHAHTHK